MVQPHVLLHRINRPCGPLALIWPYVLRAMARASCWSRWSPRPPNTDSGTHILPSTSDTACTRCLTPLLRHSGLRWVSARAAWGESRSCGRVGATSGGALGRSVHGQERHQATGAGVTVEALGFNLRRGGPDTQNASARQQSVTHRWMLDLAGGPCASCLHSPVQRTTSSSTVGQAYPVPLHPTPPRMRHDGPSAAPLNSKGI